MTIRLAIILLSLPIPFFGCGGLAKGQYIHFSEGQGENIESAVFQGSAAWLTQQQDPRSHLHKLRNLYSLELINHDITLAELRYVSTLRRIEYLTLGSAPESVKIDRSALSLLKEMSRLAGLRLCKSELKDKDLEEFKHLRSLYSLHIEGENLCDSSRSHGLTDNSSKYIVGCIDLEDLQIRGVGPFSDRFVETICALPKLTSLVVSSNQFSDRSLTLISSGPKLRRLHIGSTEFSSAGIALLGNIDTLEELIIESGQKTFSASCMRGLATLSELRVLQVPLSDHNSETIDILNGFPRLEIARFGNNEKSRELNRIAAKMILTRGKD